MNNIDPTGRLRLLCKVLETHTEDLGYQGVIDAERETATIMAVLTEAIARGKTKSLATVVSEWGTRQLNRGTEL